MGKRFKITLDKKKLGLHSKIPYSMSNKYNGQRLTPTARVLLEKIRSLSTAVKTAVCRFTYKQLCDEYGRGHSTVGEALAQLTSLGLIKKIDRDCRGTEYVYVGEPQGKSYYVIPLYLYTMRVHFNDGWRTLTDAEVRVLGYLMTQCASPTNGGNEKDGGGVCRTSYKAMSRILGLAESTVEAAVLALLESELVGRSVARIGKNRFRKSGYTVLSGLYIYKRYAGKGKTAEEKEQIREEYYAELRTVAERTKEKNVARAFRNKKFCELDTEIRVLPLFQLKLEASGHTEAEAEAKTKERKKRLRWEQGKILYAMGLTLKDLTVQYVCRECSDTGKLKGGARCECYPGD